MQRPLSVAVVQSTSSKLNTIRTVSIRDGLGGKKSNNGESNATPASLASLDESPNAHNSFRQRDKIQVAGSRKIWGTLKSTTTSAVSNTVCSLTGVNADHLIFRRKYKTNPTKNPSKWWFVIRSDEVLLKDLKEKWHLIALQTNRKIEPVLCFSNDSNATSLNHENPPTEFEAGNSSDIQPPPTSDAFLGNK